jgi:hypothetical protein
MNFWERIKTLALYLKYRAFASPATALALLESLRLKKWRFETDGTERIGFKPKFSLEDVPEAVQEKKLRVRFSINAADNAQDVYLLKSRLKNDGSDELYLNGAAMNNVDFDFDIIGFPDTRVQIELRYHEADGTFHYDRFYNQVGD